jgi:hypothetical protein
MLPDLDMPQHSTVHVDLHYTAKKSNPGKVPEAVPESGKKKPQTSVGGLLSPVDFAGREYNNITGCLAGIGNSSQDERGC